MVPAWFLYSALVGVVLSAAAWLLERSARRWGWPARWVWLVAAWTILALTLQPAFTEHVGSPPPTVVPEPAPRLAPAPGPVTAPDDGLELALPPSWLTPGVSPAWRALWIGLSGGLLLLVGAGAARLALARKRWTPREVAGRHVLLSKRTGPAVVGVVRAAIVVPRWTLGLGVHDRELVLLHEEEHLRAGDTRLLVAALVPLLVLPWNPALWWVVDRLRLAVEMDCDRRVLGRGSDRRAYGSLLLEMGRRASRSPVGLLTLARPAPFLERRLRMITRTPPRSLVRGLLTAALAGLFVFVACDLEEPPATQPLIEEVEPEDAAPPVTTTAGEDVASTGTLTGTIRRPGGEPLVSAQVFLPDLDVGALTNRQGRFVMLNVPEGRHDLVVSHVDLDAELRSAVAVRAGTTYSVDFGATDDGLVPDAERSVQQMGEVNEGLGGTPGVGSDGGGGQLPPTPPTRPDAGLVTGTVTHPDGTPVESAQVFFPEINAGALTNRQGRFVLLNVPVGTHTLRVEAAGLEVWSYEVTVEEGRTERVDAELVPVRR